MIVIFHFLRDNDKKNVPVGTDAAYLKNYFQSEIGVGGIHRCICHGYRGLTIYFQSVIHSILHKNAITTCIEHIQLPLSGLSDLNTSS